MKTALVTGASSGIGKAAALQLAAAGYRVALVSRTKENLDKVAGEISEQYENSDPLVVPCDVSSADGCIATVEHVVETFGQLDALLNIAGSAPLQPIKEITPDLWQNCINANLTSTVMLTQAAWATFEKQNSGFVGNVSSMASFDPFPGFSIYAAAKVGVNMFTKATADEGKKIGLTAVCVAPGAVETPMLRSLFDTKMIPENQTLSPAEVAQVLTDCLIGERGFTPGETIQLPS